MDIHAAAFGHHEHRLSFRPVRAAAHPSHPNGGQWLAYPTLLGFFLGILQMLLWICFPNNWVLPVGTHRWRLGVFWHAGNPMGDRRVVFFSPKVDDQLG